MPLSCGLKHQRFSFRTPKTLALPRIFLFYSFCYLGFDVSMHNEKNLEGAFRYLQGMFASPTANMLAVKKLSPKQ
jgi:hypothetical protein